MNFFKKSLLTRHNTGIEYRSFDDFLNQMNIKRDELATICSISTRTVRRYCNENNAPDWIYLVAFCAAGYLLSPAWVGWRVHNDGIVHYAAPSCNNDSIKPSMLMDMTLHHGYKRTLELKCDDLARENKQLRAKLTIVDHKRLVPKNVVPFNHTVTYEHISKQISRGKHA